MLLNFFRPFVQRSATFFTLLFLTSCSLKSQFSSDAPDVYSIRNGTSIPVDVHPAVGVLRIGIAGLCTATLIDSLHLVTAAHCVIDMKTGIPFSAPQLSFARSFTPEQWKRNDPSVFHPILSSAPHPVFLKTRARASDIALLRLRAPISLSSYPVISRSHTLSENDLGLSIGFGLSSDDPMSLGTKRTGVHVFVGQVLESNKFPFYIFKPAPNGQTTCSGDSGGPTLHNDKLVALTSGGNRYECEGKTESYLVPLYLHTTWLDRLRGINANAWHNKANPLDVNGDSHIDLADMFHLLTIRTLPFLPDEKQIPTGTAADGLFIDIDNNGRFGNEDASLLGAYLDKHNPPPSPYSPQYTRSAIEDAIKGNWTEADTILIAFSNNLDQKHWLHRNPGSDNQEDPFHLNWGGMNEKWFQSKDGWVYLTPLGHLYRWDDISSQETGLRGELLAVLHPKVYVHIDWLLDNRIEHASVSELAKRLDLELRLNDEATHFYNDFGMQEKWFWGASGWYALLPNGKLYKWARVKGELGTVVAELNSSFYEDPGLLVHAHE